MKAYVVAAAVIDQVDGQSTLHSRLYFINAETEDEAILKATGLTSAEFDEPKQAAYQSAEITVPRLGLPLLFSPDEVSKPRAG